MMSFGRCSRASSAHRVVVEPLVLLAHAVVDGLNHLPDMLGFAPWVRWPPAERSMREEGVAGLQQREEHRLVGLAAGVRLDVGEAAPKSCLARSIARVSATSTNWQPP